MNGDLADNGLSVQERKAVNRFIQQAKRVLRLGAWRIELSTGHPDPGSLAEIAPTEGRAEAVMWVSGTLLCQPEPYVREILVHELLHLHHHRLNEDFAILDTDEPTIKFVLANVEHLVDAVAKIVAPLVADIPAPTRQHGQPIPVREPATRVGRWRGGVA